jgi:hypothetical protein
MNTPLLTIGLAVYGQPMMLAEWFSRLQASGVLDPADLEVVVVDDCGDPPVEMPAVACARVLRIMKDTPWNQGEARNLAAREARGKVLLMLDPDMTLPRDQLHLFLDEAKVLRKRHVVRPVLKHRDGALDSTSPNVYLIHREDFLRCGYDLCYSGHKGYGDVELSNVWAKLYKQRVAATLQLDFHHGGLVSDAQVTKISRDLVHNRKLFHERHRRHGKIGVMAFVEERSPQVRSPWMEVQRCPSG